METKEKKKKKGRKLIAAVIAAVLVVSAGVVVLAGGRKDAGYAETTVEARDITAYLEFSGNIEAVDTSKVYAKASAQISEVLVEEGDAVKAGDVIATLDSGDVEYNISLKELTLEQSKLNDAYSIKDSRTNLENLNEQLNEGKHSNLNTSQKSLLTAQESYQEAADAYNQVKADYDAGTAAAVVSARQSLSSAQASYASAEEQNENDLITDEALATYAVSLSSAEENYKNAQEDAKQEVDDAYQAMLDAEEALADAERDYDTAELSVDQNVKTYEDTLEKTETLSNEKSSELELAHLKESLEDYTICAPFDGYVTQLDMKAGDYVTNSVSVAEVTNFDTMQVAVKIDEYDIASVKEGDSVQIYIDALDVAFEGKIKRISKTATIQNDISYLEAVVEFEADEQVRSGFSAEVKLIRADEKSVPALPVENISYRTDNTAYVNIRNEKGDIVEQSVTLGVSDGIWVQITDGVGTGNTILTKASAGTAGFPMGMNPEMMEQ